MSTLFPICFLFSLKPQKLLNSIIKEPPVVQQLMSHFYQPLVFTLKLNNYWIFTLRTFCLLWFVQKAANCRPINWQFDESEHAFQNVTLTKSRKATSVKDKNVRGVFETKLPTSWRIMKFRWNKPKFMINEEQPQFLYAFYDHGKLCNLQTTKVF